MGTGWKEYNKRKSEQKFFSGGSMKGNLFLFKNNPKRTRFVSDPYFYKAHYIENAPPGNKMEPCRESIGDDCILCYYSVGKNQKKKDENVLTIRHSWLRAAWKVYDYSRYHILEGKGGIEPCTMGEKGSCRLCDEGNKAIPNGIKVVSLSTTEADKIESHDKTLNKRCKNCGKGRISTAGYSCPECGKSLDYYDSDTDETLLTCKDCEKQVDPVLEYECSNCDDPVPATYKDCDVFIALNDDNKKVFDWEPEDEIPEEVEEALKQDDVDLAEKFAPKPNDILKKVIFTSRGRRNNLVDKYDKGTGGEADTDDTPF